MKKFILLFLDIYQKFFTLIGFGSCRYYPTCSEYAKWQFEENSLMKAFYYTTKRVLSCNQLFEGGIDYPIVKKNLNCNRVCACNKDKKLFFVKFYLVEKTDKRLLVKHFSQGSDRRDGLPSKKEFHKKSHYHLIKSFKKENID